VIKQCYEDVWTILLEHRCVAWGRVCLGGCGLHVLSAHEQLAHAARPPATAVAATAVVRPLAALARTHTRTQPTHHDAGRRCGRAWLR
jgi:hypothetical protein